ncbi:MAG: bifunctional (p)ppGpp synthetase/guanosine-3',5'-bis(diphosphate) 3'-pyrophosphohydrolase [Actinomycetota bacterium]
MEKLIKQIEKYNPRADVKLIKRAYQIAKDCHVDQFRKSGDEFIEHPLGVAQILADLELDTTTIIAALLHDAVEDTSLTLKRIRDEFGDEICNLIDGVTKLSRIKFKSHEEQQAENLRKMLIAMAKDIRVILIKLADRLHNMRTISHLSREKRKRIASETLEIYAPIAHRLGISQVKWELEDLAFSVLEPRKYAQIEKMVAESREEREVYVNMVIKALAKELNSVGIKCEISGRSKHFYSIYQKMVQKDREFSEIYDLTAIRVIIDSIRDCYGALGTIHSVWKPVPGRFKDYIAMPKFNMYQSLHTTVIGPMGRPLEIQIRTKQMHKTAEYGIAAHWRYKEGVKESDEFDERLAWLRQILEWQSELRDPREFMETLKIDLFEDEVFVFTPKGDVVSLPTGSTPIDFAYTIHTDVGHGCIGAKVNNQIVPLNYKLQMGDIVEILTSKTASGPSKDWLQIVKTSRARSKIKQWFSKLGREDSEHLGKDALQKILRKHGLGLHSATSNILESVAKEFNFHKIEDLYVSIGVGKTSAKQVATRLITVLKEEKPEEEEKILVAPPRKRRTRPITGVKIKGLEDALVRLARCCNPVPRDEIIGFVTRGRGVSVHRRDCPNAKQLLSSPDRLIEVYWDVRGPAAFQVEIQVEAIDRMRLLRDISSVVSDAGVNILSANVTTTRDGFAIFRFSFEIENLERLENILSNIRKIDVVFDAHRVLPT